MNRFTARTAAKYSLMFLLCLLVSSHIPGCGRESVKNSPAQAEKAECGECLAIKSPQVCTSSGTKQNACLAICQNVKIECYQACPCPAPR